MSPSHFISIIVLSPNRIRLQVVHREFSATCNRHSRNPFQVAAPTCGYITGDSSDDSTCRGQEMGEGLGPTSALPVRRRRSPAGGLRHSPITPPAGTATQRSPSIGQYGGIEYGALPVNYAVFGNLLCPSMFNIHRQQPLGRGLEKKSSGPGRWSAGNRSPRTDRRFFHSVATR